MDQTKSACAKSTDGVRVPTKSGDGCQKTSLRSGSKSVRDFIGIDTPRAEGRTTPRPKAGVTERGK